MNVNTDAGAAACCAAINKGCDDIDEEIKYIDGDYDPETQTCSLTYVTLTHHRVGDVIQDTEEGPEVTVED